jgi:isoleucyl-tRNA synthetase
MSVHMTVFPAGADFETGLGESRRADWEALLRVREAVLKALEEKRNAKFINSSLEARISLRACVDMLDPGSPHLTVGPAMEKHAASLPAVFITSQVEVCPPEGSAGAQHDELVHVEVMRAEGTKCERCWNYSTHVGESAEWPTLCERCIAALEENIRTLGTPYVSSSAPAGAGQGGTA